MPLYDYRCKDCSHEFEVLQGMSDDPLTNCPECKQDMLEKMVSAPAFTFKGGGWYKDLYSSAGAGDKNKSTSSSESSGSSSTTKSSSSDSKSSSSSKSD